MQLPPFLQRNNDKADPAPLPAAPAAAPSPADESSPVQLARARARRRLLGAIVLLAVGIVGFPLIFETEPRQIPLDVRIETPANRATAIAAADAATTRQQEPQRPRSPPPLDRTATDAPPAAARRTQAPADEPAPEPAAAEAAAAVAPLRAASTAPASRAASASVTLPARSGAADDGVRAKALLDGADAASQPKASRFIVQVGAYSDGNALRDARQKVEKLGLKTYTQVVDGGDGGQRTRVRVGPFTTRDEADRAGARLRSAGLPVAVLVL